MLKRDPSERLSGTSKTRARSFLIDPSPADAEGDGVEVGGDAAVPAMDEAKFGVDFDVGAYFAGHAAAEIVSDLVFA